MVEQQKTLGLTKVRNKNTKEASLMKSRTIKKSNATTMARWVTSLLSTLRWCLFFG